MKNSELQLADRVCRLDDPSLGTSVVKQIENGVITFFRPYPHTGDFSWTGGVLCYVGIEQWTESVDDDRTDWHLLDRKALR